jgi:hypothetical protein
MAEVLGRLNAEMVFGPASYPGDKEMVKAWHDLTDFITGHPVLKHSKWDSDVYMGGSGGD